MYTNCYNSRFSDIPLVHGLCAQFDYPPVRPCYGSSFDEMQLHCARLSHGLHIDESMCLASEPWNLRD